MEAAAAVVLPAVEGATTAGVVVAGVTTGVVVLEAIVTGVSSSSSSLLEFSLPLQSFYQ